MLQTKHKIIKVYNRFLKIIKKPVAQEIHRINFAVTYLCNSRCTMCSIWKKYRDIPALSHNELSLDEIKEFFQDDKNFKYVDEINLTGGEPFLREDFTDLFSFLRKRFPQAMIIINTNGLRLLKEWDMDNNDLQNTVLVFSIDGLESTHDLIRGITGGYQKARQYIDYYKKAFPSLKMGISFTIVPENFNELLTVYNLSKELNLSFTMRFASQSERYYGNSQIKYEWTPAMLQQVDESIQQIIKDMKNSRGILNRLFNPDLFFYSNIVSYQQDPRSITPCYSGTHSFFINPYGELSFCIFSEYPLGNIREKTFEKIWYSSKADQFRKYIEMKSCHCWTECETLPSLKRKLIFNNRS